MNKQAHAISHTHCQTAQSPSSNQSLSISMSFSNTRTENIAAKMRHLNKTEKEGQLLTACMKNSGFSAKSKVSAFNKSHRQTESEVLLNPLLLIHAKRCQQA